MQIWGINHYKFFHVPTDRSGFYTYILDEKDYWCPTNEPCKSKPEKWNAFHGMGYTRYDAEKNGVAATATYFVGPYIYSSNIFGPESDKFGLANVSWLTGTDAWMYVAVNQYMLGIRARWDGLEIDPCVPDEMLPAKVIRVFRGKTYYITIKKNERVFVKYADDNTVITIGETK